MLVLLLLSQEIKVHSTPHSDRAAAAASRQAGSFLRAKAKVVHPSTAIFTRARGGPSERSAVDGREQRGELPSSVDITDYSNSQAHTSAWFFPALP